MAQLPLLCVWLPAWILPRVPVPGCARARKYQNSILFNIFLLFRFVDTTEEISFSSARCAGAAYCILRISHTMRSRNDDDDNKLYSQPPNLTCSYPTNIFAQYLHRHGPTAMCSGQMTCKTECRFSYLCGTARAHQLQMFECIFISFRILLFNSPSRDRIGLNNIVRIDIPLAWLGTFVPLIRTASQCSCQ